MRTCVTLYSGGYQGQIVPGACGWWVWMRCVCASFVRVCTCMWRQHLRFDLLTHTYHFMRMRMHSFTCSRWPSVETIHKNDAGTRYCCKGLLDLYGIVCRTELKAAIGAKQVSFNFWDPVGHFDSIVHDKVWFAFSVGIPCMQTGWHGQGLDGRGWNATVHATWFISGYGCMYVHVEIQHACVRTLSSW